MITMRRQQYGATLFLSEDILQDAKLDIRTHAAETLRRQLWEAGATEGFRLESEPCAYTHELPRRWWERLLRRPPRTFELRGERLVLYGYGWVTA